MSCRPPSSEAELIGRAADLAGRTFAEVGERLGLSMPADPKRAKGFTGQLLERALGARSSSRPEPDFADLGIELKTLPIGRNGMPRESTFVCTIALLEIGSDDWESSLVRRKLARVLWVPVEGDPAIDFAGRRVGAPFLWSPSPDEEALLRTDWEDIVGQIERGHIEGLDARRGRALQVRPKAATSRERARAPEADGAWVYSVPRGFYLRATFTGKILRRVLTREEVEW